MGVDAARLDVWESEKQPDQLWQFRSSLRHGPGHRLPGVNNFVSCAAGVSDVMCYVSTCLSKAEPEESRRPVKSSSRQGAAWCTVGSRQEVNLSGRLPEFLLQPEGAGITEAASSRVPEMRAVGLIRE